MKKLITKGLCILVIILALVGALMILSLNPILGDKLNLLTDSGGYMGTGTEEVRGVLNILDADTKSTKLILGDSVAAQIFDGIDTSNYLVATGNQSMTFIWQYIFVKRYLDSHPEATDIYFFITPDSLNSVWNRVLSYQYVLMSMEKFGYLNELDETSREELSEIYGSFFIEENVIRFIDNSGINRKLFLNYIQSTESSQDTVKKYGVVARIPNEYLVKTESLCKERGAKMHLICCPCKDTRQKREENEELANNFRITEVGKLFPGYFDGITYYPEEYFKDELHFKDNILTSEFKREIIEKIEENAKESFGL